LEGTLLVAQLKHCATNRKVAGSIPAGVTGFFVDIKSFWSHYGPGVDSASIRNEYQPYFLRVNAAWALYWQSYHIHVPSVFKSGSLNLLKPSRPVLACNGIALPLPYHRHCNITSSSDNVIKQKLESVVTIPLQGIKD
jgi:hypothetical protein